MQKKMMKDYLKYLLPFIGIFGAYLFAFDFLPFQDFPQWVYQGYVFKHLFFLGDDFNGFFPFMVTYLLM
jgi:hypothetical protein